MVPSAAEFSVMMRDLGVCQDKMIVIYDNSPFLSAARAWWLFRLFGKNDVYVLDGGLPAYLTAGGATSYGTADTAVKGDFTATEPLAQMITFDSLRAEIEAEADIQILDARPAGRFDGTVPEPTRRFALWSYARGDECACHRPFEQANRWLA